MFGWLGGDCILLIWFGCVWFLRFHVGGYGTDVGVVVDGFLLFCCWRVSVLVLVTLFVVCSGFVWFCLISFGRGCVFATGVYYVVCVVFGCCGWSG